MSTTKHIPDNAAPRPKNPILDRLAWTKMWVENDNTLWTVVGDTGSGKSYASMRIGEALDPDFTIDQVAFNIEEFLRLAMDDSYGQGTVIVLEEGSVEASAYDWHSASNRVFAKLLDTWRHQNRMGIINLPNFKALEKGARRRTKAIVEMQHAAPWRDYSQGKFKNVHYDNIEDKLRTPFPVINGKQRKYVRFKFPSKELAEEYEHQKENYTHQLNEDLLEELLEVGEGGSGEEMSPQKIAEQILDEGWREYVGDNNGQKYLDRGLIELDYDIGDRKGRKVKKAIQREINEEIQ